MAAHRVPASRRLDWFVSDLVGATVGVTGERNVKSWRYSEPILCASGRFTRAEYPFIWLAFEKPSVTLIELAITSLRSSIDTVAFGIVSARNIHTSQKYLIIASQLPNYM